MEKRTYLLPEDGQFYKTNMHAHTVLSDGHLTVEEVKSHYKKQGYSIVAFTDHRRYAWHKELDDDEFLTLAALEVNINEFYHSEQRSDKTKTYHFNAYDTNPDMRKEIDEEQLLPLRRYEDKQYINKYIKTMNEKGFLTCYNHPCWSMQEYPDYIFLKDLWGMEIYNYGCEHDGLYGYNPQIYDEMLRHGTNLYCLATDDNHNSYDFDNPLCDSFGGFIMVRAKELTYASVMEALKNGHFYSSMGPEILELFIENGEIIVRTGPVKKIYGITAGRFCHKKLADKGEFITEARFKFKGNEKYIRIDILDEHGLHANTNAIFVNDIDTEEMDK